MSQNIHDIKNEELLQRIREMRNNYNNDTISMVIESVIGAKLITPLATNELDIDTSNNSAISFEAVTNEEGRTFLVAFTDVGVLHEWKHDPAMKTMLLGFQDYVALMAHEESSFDGFVINPYTDNLVFDKELIYSIMQQYASQEGEVVSKTITKDSVLQLTMPKRDVTDLQNAISENLDNDPSVNAVYLLQMIREEENSLLVMVDADGDVQEVFQKIAQIGRDFLLVDEVMDFISCEESIAKDAMQKYEPFYRKV